MKGRQFQLSQKMFCFLVYYLVWGHLGLKTDVTDILRVMLTILVNGATVVHNRLTIFRLQIANYTPNRFYCINFKGVILRSQKLYYSTSIISIYPRTSKSAFNENIKWVQAFCSDLAFQILIHRNFRLEMFKFHRDLISSFYLISLFHTTETDKNCIVDCWK